MSSERTATRLARLLSMLPWVIAHPGVTVQEVCERFGYTPRQLAADLNLVFVCGLPGYGPGDLMVAYIDEDEVVVEMAEYFSSAVRLSGVEALTLLAAGMAVVSSGYAPAALVSGVAKLQRVLLPDSVDSLVVDLSYPEFADSLRSAAAKGEVVGITYTAVSSGDTTERDVEPWTVFSTLGNWYVVGYCRLAEDERVFRVDRIRAAAVTGESFVPPQHTSRHVVSYSPGVDDVTATIELGPSAGWITDYYPVDIVSRRDDSMTVRMSTSDPLVAARLLLRLGTIARLVSGQEVQDALLGLRARILARYDSPSE